jgi:hypothetical protein
METKYILDKLDDAVLIDRLHIVVKKNSDLTALLLAYVGEVDHRKLYLPAGFSSMHVFCTDRLSFSEAIAYKRIHSARAAPENSR